MLFNRDRAEGAMREYGLDAIIATTPENVTYMTAFSFWGNQIYAGNTPDRGAQTYALYAGEGNGGVSIITTGTALTYFASNDVPVDPGELWVAGEHIVYWPEDALPVGPDEQRLADLFKNANSVGSTIQGLIDAIQKRGLSTGRVGLETMNLSPYLRNVLQERFPGIAFLEAGDFFRYLRFVKTPDELERIRVAAEVNEEAIMACIKLMRPGVSEKEIRREFKLTLGQHDGLFEFFNVPSGRRAGAFFPPSDYRLKPGDSIWIDGGSIVNEYHADTGTCAFIGEPPREHRAMYEAMWNTCQVGLEMVRPGVTGTEIHHAMLAAEQKNGLFPVGAFGHGIGLEARDYPLVQAQVPPKSEDPTRVNLMSHDLPLEVNSVINIEVPYWQFGYGGVHIEYTLVVTPTGYREIIPYERELLVL